MATSVKIEEGGEFVSEPTVRVETLFIAASFTVATGGHMGPGALMLTSEMHLATLVSQKSANASAVDFASCTGAASSAESVLAGGLSWLRRVLLPAG